MYPHTRRAELLVVTALLAFVIADAHFWRSGRFGLYEDDFSFVGRTMNWSAADLLGAWNDSWTNWPTGRPLGRVIGNTLGFAGWSLAGLPGAYVLGFVVVLTACVAFFIVVRYRFGIAIALPAAMVFAIHPADTTKPLLTHALSIYPAIVFFFFAVLLYMRGRWFWSYALVLAALLTYETPVPLFLAVPLLGPRTGRRLASQLALNAVILLSLMASVMLVRHLIGEVRVAEAWVNVWDLPRKVILAMLAGPLVSMQSLLSRPAETLLTRPGLVGWLPALIFLAIALPAWHCLIPTGGRHDPPLQDQGEALDASSITASVQPAWLRRSLLAGVIGIAMLALGYALSFTHFPPTAIAGRLTSVHMAGAIGGSLLAGAVVQVVLVLAGQCRVRGIALVALVAYASLLVGFHNRVQRDFVEAWDKQRDFWRELLPLISDAGEGTVVLVDRSSMQDTTYISAYSWSSRITLQMLYEFPPHWNKVPRVCFLNRDCQIRLNDNRLQWYRPWWSRQWIDLEPQNTILIQKIGGNLVRRSDFNELAGQTLQLKPKPDAASIVPHLTTPLHATLVGRPE